MQIDTNKKRTHICDGGDDHGLVGCFQCEKEMIEHFKRSKKSNQIESCKKT